MLINQLSFWIDNVSELEKYVIWNHKNSLILFFQASLYNLRTELKYLSFTINAINIYWAISTCQTLC